MTCGRMTVGRILSQQNASKLDECNKFFSYMAWKQQITENKYFRQNNYRPLHAVIFRVEESSLHGNNEIKYINQKLTETVYSLRIGSKPLNKSIQMRWGVIHLQQKRNKRQMITQLKWNLEKQLMYIILLNVNLIK